MGRRRPSWAGILQGLVLCGIATHPAPAPVAQQRRARAAFTVGVVYDGEPRLNRRSRELLDLIVNETLDLTAREFKVRFPEDKRISGGWELERIGAAIDRLLGDPEVDLVIAAGVLATNRITRIPDLPKPVIGVWAVEVLAQRLPYEERREGTGVSGVKNLNYLVVPGGALRDLQQLLELVDVRTIHILVDELIMRDIPDLRVLVDRSAVDLDVALQLVPVGESADAALAALPEHAEAVYVTPLIRFLPGELDRLIEGLIERRLPSLSTVGRPEVELGILAGLRPETDIPRLARRVALNIQRILLGEDAGELPVSLELESGLVINMKTARAIGVSPRWRISIDAELLHDEREVSRTLTLAEVLAEAQRSYLFLRSAERALTANAETIRRAESERKPGVHLRLHGVQIDEDRAEAGLGQAERALTAGVRLQQLVFSEDANARVVAARRLQRAAEEDYEVRRLDLALDVSSAYLDVLRAQNLEDIARANLQVTKSNLELARRRERLGAAPRSEVYRWRSRRARDISSLIAARNGTDTTRLVLNRYLHEPLEETFGLREPTLEDPDLITCCERLEPYVNNRAAYEIFREFSVQEGLANAHELRALDASIDAQDRVLQAARRSFWAPRLVFEADIARDLSRGGAGSDGAALPGLPGLDRDVWSLGLFATLPLYAGGARRADTRQSSEQLASLRIEREAVAELIGLQIRAALFQAGTSFPAIELAQEAAEAADRNLELVTESYSQGVVSIVDLLDAQNNALVSNVDAANAVFDFLLDLMQVQRATSTFDFYASAEGRDAWFERLREYFEESRVEREAAR